MIFGLRPNRRSTTPVRSAPAPSSERSDDYDRRSYGASNRDGRTKLPAFGEDRGERPEEHDRIGRAALRAGQGRPCDKTARDQYGGANGDDAALYRAKAGGKARALFCLDADPIAADMAA